jgi:hypothetical protein
MCLGLPDDLETEALVQSKRIFVLQTDPETHGTCLRRRRADWL